MRPHSMPIVAAIAAGLIAFAACTPSAPAASLVAAASQRPTPTPVEGPTLGEPVVVNLVAGAIKFQPAVLLVPADVPFVIHFRNAETQDIPHNVDIRQLDGITVLRRQDAIDGGVEANYRYAALPRGDYQFICAVHPIPAMTGILKVR